ncbi:hypothetical protein EYF80_002726 [Liparis tanakae]|uniref:Uncharacterized protein n=1 Tax=Liparis tanakae TaxID=230148 RepID=A0A4Z2JAK2_9TELE|nr:hypothetical protein EYF80_002726 [Liparis tanakae]
MTEEPPEQLGLGILVSRTIVCPLSLSLVRPRAASTDSQHQLIIAAVACHNQLSARQWLLLLRATTGKAANGKKCSVAWHSTLRP